ncbi:hypothetical protein FACS189419_04990 [Planctomycetales bacterium]|nr:hypothetical protein FACS189419_04990 [Planctomycetales bacterium]
MAIKQIKRVYVDTSVVNAPFDTNEHAPQTRPFWNAVMNGEIHIIVSDILEGELEKAPAPVRDFFFQLKKSDVEFVTSSEQSNELAAQYIAEGIVTEKWLDDCKHIALATICRADYLVSWNFKHFVNVNKIRCYNGVNLKLGYQTIDIRTPYEVINGTDETED